MLLMFVDWSCTSSIEPMRPDFFQYSNGVSEKASVASLQYRSSASIIISDMVEPEERITLFTFIRVLFGMRALIVARLFFLEAWLMYYVCITEPRRRQVVEFLPQLFPIESARDTPNYSTISTIFLRDCAQKYFALPLRELAGATQSECFE